MSLLRSGAKLAFTVADVFMPTPPGPRLLIYHQVGAGLGRQMEVETSDFEWQIQWVAENRDVVDLDTALAQWNAPMADRLVVLTFDDGYQDLFTTAFPLMKDLSLPFTLYIATEMVETGESRNGARPIGWEEISIMLDSGLLTVGGHTHTHRDLRGATREETLDEIDRTNTLIEKRLGIEPRHFAYPWGYWSPSAHEAVAMSYESAALGAPRGVTEFDLHKVHRFPIQLSDATRWFRARLRGGLLGEEWVRRYLRGYHGP